MEGEIGQAQLETAVGLQPQEFVELVPEPRLAECRQAHDLVFALVDLEAEVGRQGRIEQAQRVGIFDRPDAGQLGALALPDGGGDILAHAVDGEDRRPLIGAGKEGAGRVAAVVGRGRHQPARDPQHGRDAVQHPDLGAELAAQGAGELLPRPREGPQRRQDHPLQAHEGVLVEDNAVQVPGRQSGLVQAGLGGLARQAGVVLATGEPLLLHGGDHLAVDHQGRGGVVIVG